MTNIRQDEFDDKYGFIPRRSGSTSKLKTELTGKMYPDTKPKKAPKVRKQIPRNP